MQTDSGIPADTAYHTFMIRAESGTVEFFHNGVLGAIHTTNLPDQDLAFSILIQTIVAAAKSLDVDLVSIASDRI